MRRFCDPGKVSLGQLFANEGDAIKAVRMQEAGPASSESSATVLQGPKESCTNFIDRLQNILQQVEHQEAQGLLLKQPAMIMPMKIVNGQLSQLQRKHVSNDYNAELTADCNSQVVFWNAA